MIKRYNNISLFKSKDAPQNANENKPYYDIVAKESKEAQEKIYPGKFWFKQSESGLNFFSGEMSKERTWEGKNYKGYTIVSTSELDELEKELEQLKSIPTGQGYKGTVGTGEVSDLSSVPF